MKILISAGEASGEMYGAELIRTLRCREPGLTFFGAGGERMRDAGCDIIVDARDLAVVGITEIVSQLRKILGLYKKLIRTADEKKPDLAIVIDSPAFNWRVARQMQKRGIPVVYYVCPQFWAWRQGRVKLLRKYVSKALVIFPFEEKFYRDRGVDATFIGHPLAYLPLPESDRERFAHQYGMDPAKQWIVLMPGSRRKEVRMNLPTMLEAASGLDQQFEFVLPVARTLDESFLRSLIDGHSAARGGGPQIRLVPEALAALRHARAGVIASGTATVEAAMMGTPFVMVYRVTPLTYALGRPRVKLSHFAMVNLIAGEEVVPELVQSKFTADKVRAELGNIIPDGPVRREMITKLASVVQQLRFDTGQVLHTPAERAAKQILELAGQKISTVAG